MAHNRRGPTGVNCTKSTFIPGDDAGKIFAERIFKSLRNAGHLLHAIKDWLGCDEACRARKSKVQDLPAKSAGRAIRANLTKERISGREFACGRRCWGADIGGPRAEIICQSFVFRQE